MRTRPTRMRAFAAILALSVVVVACGDDDDDDDAPANTEASSDATDAGTGTTAAGWRSAPQDPTGPGCADIPAEGEGSFAAMADEPDGTAVATPGEGPQGPLCASLPVDGEGSFAGMADDPVGVAASNNPELETLTEAIEAAGLTDTLNGPGPFTIFAPSDDAFAEIPAADLDAVLADTDQLTSILDFHVISGQSLSAADLAAAGTEVSVQGGELTFSVEADGSLSINGGSAHVVCSNITVGNATVHIIDSVLVPPTE